MSFFHFIQNDKTAHDYFIQIKNYCLNKNAKNTITLIFQNTKILLPCNVLKLTKFELEFKEYIEQSKNQEKMEYSIDFLETFASREVKAIREEEREKAREEREKSIMNIRKQLGFNAKQIATLLPFPIKYIQSVIDKFEKKEKEGSGK